VSEQLLDARRLLCPLPVIRVQERVAALRPGARLRVVATDPGALQDIPAWCRINGHRVLESFSRDHEHFVLLEVAGE
jgi:tRNA 2-thiouridine synthesizing protein A